MKLRVLLAVLGFLMMVASRWQEAFRRQLTRDVVIEIRTDDGVAHHFVFRGRTATSRFGRAAVPDCTLRFDSAERGFAILAAQDGPARLLAGLGDGTVRIDGTSALFGWFSGLVRSVVPGAPALRLPATPPHAYVRPAPSSAGAAFITREPAAAELDPAWTAAVAARAKLLLVRVEQGERPKPF